MLWLLSRIVAVVALLANPGGVPPVQHLPEAVAGVSVQELDLSGVDLVQLDALPASVAPLDPGDPGGVPVLSGSGGGGAAGLLALAPVRVASSVSSDAPGEPSPDVLTRPLPTATFSVFGVSWKAAPDLSGVSVRFRTREAGVWTDWAAVGASDDGQLRESGAGGDRVNTDAIVVHKADGLQIWIESAAGVAREVKAVLVNPGADPVAAPGIASSAFVSRPALITRAQWGADESLRTCEPDYAPYGMVAATVHHTASSNDYTADEVAGIIRGFYAYHTRPEAQGGRGWCDIGYNFLVDRFGRVFEGRAGSIDTTVIGVHVGGFNSRSYGVAAIGTFSTVEPPAAMLESISQVIAWKFATNRIYASSSVTMVSGGGASKFPEGTVVTFSAIYGHRDAQYTDCPGERLYARLGDIRARVSQLADAAIGASPLGNWDIAALSAGALNVAGWALDPEDPAPLTVDVVVDGSPHPILADVERSDIGAAFPSAGSRHGYAATLPVGLGRHVVCIWARNIHEGNDRLLGCPTVTVAGHLPVGSLDVVSGSSTSITVAGWALDVDAVVPVLVHVYVDGTATAGLVADLARPDVGAAFPGMGDRHGFAVTFPSALGVHQVCVYALDVPPVFNTSLGCRTVTVG